MNNDGVMICSGKMLFTVNQWRELEMQTLIYKYLMASIPVPPQLLLHLSSQSNSGSVGFKFSNGLDPEPWRCRRTDGKKWRCSKKVAYDQKYCERHARKTGPRSRKPVETQTYDVKDRPSMLSASNQQTEMLSGDRDVCEDVYNTLQPWLNQGSWACLGSGLTPGGPLGEALCLGIASTRMEPSSTTSSSCDDGGLNLVNRHDG